MTVWNQLESYFPGSLIPKLYSVRNELDSGIREIRLRCGRPIQVLGTGGMLTLCRDRAEGSVFTNDEAEELLLRLLEYSSYRRETEQKYGYVTLPHGHRVGFCGRSLVEEGRTLRIVEPSSFNIRIARSIPGAAGDLPQRIMQNNGPLNTLILSAPGGGKTTVLRDVVARLTGAPRYLRGALIDERGEIAAAVKGTPALPVGFADVLTGISKAEGTVLALRTLNPEIIFMDEVAPGDLPAIMQASVSGVAVAATLHAGSFREAYLRAGPDFIHRFQLLVKLSGPGLPMEVRSIEEVAE